MVRCGLWNQLIVIAQALQNRLLSNGLTVPLFGLGFLVRPLPKVNPETFEERTPAGTAEQIILIVRPALGESQDTVGIQEPGTDVDLLGTEFLPDFAEVVFQRHKFCRYAGSAARGQTFEYAEIVTGRLGQIRLLGLDVLLDPLPGDQSADGVLETAHPRTLGEQEDQIIPVAPRAFVSAGPGKELLHKVQAISRPDCAAFGIVVDDRQPYPVGTVGNCGLILRKGNDLESVETGINLGDPLIQDLPDFGPLNLSRALLEAFIDRGAGTEQEMIALAAHIPGAPLRLFQTARDISQIDGWASHRECNFGRRGPLGSLGQTMQEGHQGRFRCRGPGPVLFNELGMAIPADFQHIGLQSALERRTTQTRQYLVTNLATGQVDMMRGQQIGILEFILTRPDSADGAADQPQCAAGRLELRDIRQAFGKQADQFRMKRVSPLELLKVARLKGAVVNGGARRALVLVIFDIGFSDSLRLGLIDMGEQAPRQNCAALGGLGGGEAAGLANRSVFSFVDRLQGRGDVLFQIPGKPGISIVLRRQGDQHCGLGPLARDRGQGLQKHRPLGIDLAAGMVRWHRETARHVEHQLIHQDQQRTVAKGALQRIAGGRDAGQIIFTDLFIPGESPRHQG